MRRRVARMALVVSALGGCAPATGLTPTEDVVAADARGGVPDAAAMIDAIATDETTDDTSFDGYPEGPYGNSVESTLADLALEGFVNDSRAELSTQAPFVSYSLAELRRGGARYALVHTSGFL